MKPALILSFTMCFMLFLYAPLELYFSNKSEFWFDIYTLFPVMLGIFVLAFVGSCVVFMILRLIHKKVYQAGFVSYFIAFLCTYIQGNFLVMGLPPLAGTPIFWENYPGERIKCIVMWVVVAVLVMGIVAWIHMEKFTVGVNYLCGFLNLILLVTIVSVCVMNGGLEKKVAACVTSQDEYAVSTDRNFIILLLDSLDSRFVNVAMNAHDENREAFEDFTYYPNMVGTYGYTKIALPYILSGVWYENEEPFEQYNVEAYKSSAFLSRLEEEGYRLDLYTTEMPLTDECILKFDNVMESRNNFNSMKTFAEYWLKLVGYKYAPFDWKAKCVFDQTRFVDLKVAPEGTETFNDYNAAFYEGLVENDIEVKPGKCFKLIHLEGAHAPYSYDGNMNWIGYGEGTYEGITDACLTLTKTYLNRLKEAGVYDNSVIIVMADHGYQENDDPWGRWNPAFLVKGIHEDHEFQVSNAPISYEDLQEAFHRLLDGRDSSEIFDWKEGDQRERRYIYYEYEKDEDMYEAVKTGYAWELDGMTFTGTEYHRKK